MLGSILSNMLLVLGCCFLAGGLKYHEQNFNSTVASTMSSLMAVSSASLIIPSTLYAVMVRSGTDEDIHNNIEVLSRGTAIILLVLYVAYLFFQLRTHADLFDEEQSDEDGDENNEEAQILSPWAAGVALVIITVAVAICAEFLVGSIDSIVERAHISKTFVGLILLPIVGNAAEHVTAVVVAMKDKMNLAIGVAIGSSMQIALLVTPFLVILGWIIDQPMTLKFEPFETVVFFLSVLITNYLIAVCVFFRPVLPPKSVSLTSILRLRRTGSQTTSKELCCSACTSSSPLRSTSTRTTQTVQDRLYGLWFLTFRKTKHYPNRGTSRIFTLLSLYFSVK